MLTLRQCHRIPSVHLRIPPLLGLLIHCYRRHGPMLDPATLITRIEVWGRYKSNQLMLETCQWGRMHHLQIPWTTRFVSWMIREVDSRSLMMMEMMMLGIVRCSPTLAEQADRPQDL